VILACAAVTELKNFLAFVHYVQILLFLSKRKFFSTLSLFFENFFDLAEWYTSERYTSE